MQRFCAVSIVHKGFRTAHVTAGSSLFEASAGALHWFEVELQSFGTAFIPDDDELLEVSVAAGDTYRVRVGKVRQWVRERAAQDASRPIVR